jgi:hypothetical protein
MVEVINMKAAKKEKIKNRHKKKLQELFLCLIIKTI